MMNKAVKKKTYERVPAAGKNKNAPVANNNKPNIIPPLYPNLFINCPAGTAIKK